MAFSEKICLVSIEEYLKNEQVSPIRHEYIRGYLYAKVGASILHNLITGRLFSIFLDHLETSPCHTFQ